jgi:putative heme-binding domain-containing protein
LAFIDDKSSAEAMLDLAGDGPAKGEAARWLLRNANGEWKKYGVMEELKKRAIYDPSKIVVTSITAPKPDNPKFSVQDVIKLKGDAAKGKITANRCIMCHEFNGVGVNYGPNLKGWGEGQTPEIIALSIIDPSAEISHGYSGSGIELKKGGHVHGVASSDGDPMIITSTGGVTQMIPRNRIKSKRPYKLKHSLMLSADQMGLTPQDVADLTAFLKEYK